MSPSRTIQSHIERDDFPCIMAQAALRRGNIRHAVCGQLGEPGSAARTNELLRSTSDIPADAGFRSTVAMFDALPAANEALFEERLWAHLAQMRAQARQVPLRDQGVSENPADPNFRFCLEGEAYYVIGLHPGASRPGRRAPRPMLVFNLHRQFEELRRRGRYESVRDTIRERDLAANGSINPALDDFGSSSEARQYAGRQVEEDWQCPVAL